MEKSYDIEKITYYKNAQLTYYIKVNKEKETILFLHPAFADHAIFEAQLDYFKNNYQIIALDMPGHGNNNKTSSKVTLKDVPEIIKQLMDENHITACHIVGVSLGALVAQAFADRHNNMVRSVTIVGGYSIHKCNEKLLKAQSKEALKWILYIIFSMKKFKSYVISVSTISDRGRKVFSHSIQKFRRSSFSAMSGMKSFFIKKDSPMSYTLMIMCGEHDLQIAKDAAVELHKLEPNSQYMLIHGAGHCANIDNPDDFNFYLENFLSSL